MSTQPEQENDESEVPSSGELSCFTLEPSGLYWGDTDEFKTYVASERVKWTSVIKAAGIEPE